MNVLDKSVATSSIEEMATLLDALTRFRKGDAKVRLPLHWTGLSGKVADAFNDVVEQNAALAAELARLRQVVGKEGKLKQRAVLAETRGFWGESIECVNALIDDLVHPTSEVGARDRRGGAGRPVARPWRWKSTAGRWRASSCAPPRPSTRWWTSSAPSRPK